MPTVYSSPPTSPTALTPSTIQCTQFYSNDHRGVTNQLKRLNQFCKSKKYLTEREVSLTCPSMTALLLLNRYTQTRPCLDINLAESIRIELPTRISILPRWTLIYSLDQHGASLSTLYEQCKQTTGPCLLVIRDNQQRTFGAYLTDTIHHNSSYYGAGECFLWTQDEQNHIQIYRWTMKNDYMIYSNQSFIAVGGGEGQFGLWIHSDMIHGYSEPCATFQNPSLAVSNSFECIGLEIWGFLY